MISDATTVRGAFGVEVQGLEKRYGTAAQAAVRQVSFQAPAGAITALIGPSGSGKTTLLRLIAGLETPDCGRVFIGGDDVTTAPPQRRGVGLVFQGYALFPHLSVFDNVAFGLRARGDQTDDVAQRVREMLRLVQLEHLAARRPAELSGGQRQRIAFARALAIEPRLLLLDEPFGALDARVRAELRGFLMRLHDETGVTTVLVTHDQEEALEVSQHVVLLLDGAVAQAGGPQELYDRPANPATASFLGASAWKGALPRAGVDVVPGSVAFVRPEDIRLTRAPADGIAQGRTGSVARCKVVGARVKVQIRVLDQAVPGAADRAEIIDVDVARDEFEALGVQVGDLVLLDVKNARVFLGDYVI